MFFTSTTSKLFVIIATFLVSAHTCKNVAAQGSLPLYTTYVIQETDYIVAPLTEEGTKGLCVQIAVPRNGEFIIPVENIRPHEQKETGFLSGVIYPVDYVLEEVLYRQLLIVQQSVNADLDAIKAHEIHQKYNVVRILEENIVQNDRYMQVASWELTLEKEGTVKNISYRVKISPAQGRTYTCFFNLILRFPSTVPTERAWARLRALVSQVQISIVDNIKE